MRFLTKFVDKCLENLTHRSGIFITYSIQRINKDQEASVPHNPNPFGSNLAIVLQGPVSKFTYLACSYYLYNYKDLTVILSTWETENTSSFNKLLPNNRFHLIKSAKPIFEGISNVNLQITSTLRGVERATELKCEYVIKSRTDQILLSKDFLDNLNFIIQNYGVNDHGQNRIVISEKNSFVSRIYGISDMFQFGKTPDIFKYWDCKLDARQWKDIENQESASNDAEGFARLRLAEVYVSTNYLERMEHELTFSLKDSLKCFRQYFVVLDNSKSGLVWNKYGRDLTRLQNLDTKFRELDFLTWLRLIELADHLEEERD